MESPERPLSPFLIYRWGVTNTLSIIHRATGVFLSLGLLVFSCWLMSIASGPEAYAAIADFYGSTWFRLPFAGWIFCFFYHLANGVRHLVWDAGYGFERSQIAVGGAAVVGFALVATGVYAVMVLL
jgi:succinate dehydrogenase / fumarate reductase cytochrome b subunit